MFSANSSQVSDAKLYVEDVFSTWLYTGGVFDPLTITNGIDLSGKGGLVWIKNRGNANSHILCDTARGVSRALVTDTTAAEAVSAGAYVTSFNSNGFALGGNSIAYNGAYNYASWTFREAPKFFDVVTWTGNNVSGRAIPHNLGITPGCIIVKRTSGLEDWWVYHRSGISIGTGRLNLTDGFGSASPTGLFTSAPTATEFYVSADAGVNASGSTYVAYLFAHDTATNGIIQCGSYTGNGSATGPTVTLGWEPQWVLVKNATTGYDWWMLDNMRGFTAPSANDAYLVPNSSQAEAATQDIMSPTATGFQLSTSGPMFNRSGDTFIYIAIRRGPMRTPTSGTSVFNATAYTGTSTTQNISANFPADMAIAKNRDITQNSWLYTLDRLRGKLQVMSTNDTSAEFVMADTVGDNTSSPIFDVMSGITYRGATGTNRGSAPYVAYQFRRAPSFFDEVCYTGTGSARTVNHNLGVAPELMIVKRRNAVESWLTYAAPVSATKALAIDLIDAAFTYNVWNDTAPTTTVFSVSSEPGVNASGSTYVAYLFASCPGVSKVGSYTGNGSSQTINCGFAAGARFVLIKRTDSTGNWLVADSARGIVAGNDPLLYLNSTAAEVTTLDWIDADASGFIVNQDATANANVNGATYIYLAIS